MLKNENLPNVIALGTAETFDRVYQSNILEDKKPKEVIKIFQIF